MIYLYDTPYMELVRLLNKLEASDLPEIADHVLTDDSLSLINEIEDLAERLLITEEGRPHFENHAFLSEHGFHVFPGEVDSFGWLSGCIQTKKGVIVYG